MLLVIKRLTAVSDQDDMHILLVGSKYLEFSLSVFLIDVHYEVFRSLLYHSQLPIRHEVLCELLLLVWHQP